MADKVSFYTVKNIWKSYIWTADKDVNESDPRSNVHYLGSSENKAWKKKIQACTGFEPMTSASPVQRSINWANKPTVVLFVCMFSSITDFEFSLTFLSRKLTRGVKLICSSLILWPPKSDQNLISPYNITTDLNITDTRIQEMITN